MGSNPIIGTSETAFYEGKTAKTAWSIDSACSRIKTHGLPIYLPSFAKFDLGDRRNHMSKLECHAARMKQVN
ncbi:MAG TPA: hypothetical protein DCO65_05100 [Spartobacteria bacterium]|jgi:hypothetical protein|nr:hypothetical protein [Spartobacteria bacterium]